MSKISISLQTEGLLTFQEAADLLGQTRPMVYHLIDTDKLHRIDFFGNAYVLKDEVEKLKANNKPKINA